MNMEEEKVHWVEKFSKDELIEDIQKEFATDARNYMGCGGFFLLLLVLNCFSNRWMENVSLPVFVVILAAIEIWWKKKMSKCNDAHRLVAMYDKYRIISKIIAGIAVLALCIYHYIDQGEHSVTSAAIWFLFGIIIVGICLWSLFRKKKTPVELEIDRLRELLAQE